MGKFIITEEDKKHILSLYNIDEALTPSQYRPYVKEFNRERYSEIFKTLGDKYDHDKNYYRIYIPLVEGKKEGPVSPIQKEVEDFLKQNGYQVLDYIKGIVKFGESKNTTTIGKALTRMKADNLMKKFVSDESRKALTSDSGGLLVVISRHPYDIAGSDTDRNWTNCMTMGHESSQRVQKLKKEYEDLIKNNPDTEDILRKQNYEKLSRGEDIDFDGMKKKFDDAAAVSKKIDKLEREIESRKERGQNVKYIIEDVKEGSLVSYLINKNDKDIKNPISVLNIKPYINEQNKNDFILVSDEQMYGQGRPEFKQTVDNILSEINGVGKEGFYCLNEKLYADSPERIGIFNDDFLNEVTEGIKKVFVENIDKISKDFYNMAESDMMREITYSIQQLLDGDEDDYDEKFNEHIKTLEDELGKKQKEMIEGFKKCFFNEVNNNFFNKDLINNEIRHFTGKKVDKYNVINTLYERLYYEIFEGDCSTGNFKDPMEYIGSVVYNKIAGI
jgi:ribosomal protein S13